MRHTFALLFAINIGWALGRESLSSFSHYYFLDVNTLGLQQVAINALGLFVALVFFLFLFFFTGKKSTKGDNPAAN